MFCGEHSGFGLGMLAAVKYPVPPLSFTFVYRQVCKILAFIRAASFVGSAAFRALDKQQMTGIVETVGMMI